MQGETACRYERADNQLICSTKTFSTAGTTNLTIERSTYASLRDFVEETAVVPPRKLARRIVSESTDFGFVVTVRTTDRLFDGLNRLVQEDGGFSWLPELNQSSTTYTSWDAAGRPLAARNNFNPGQTRTFAYDQTARTMIETIRFADPTASPTSCTRSYDSDGTLTSEQCSSPARAMFVRVVTTDTVCP